VEGRFASSSSFSWVSPNIFGLRVATYSVGWSEAGWFGVLLIYSLPFLPIRMTDIGLPAFLLAGWVLSDKHCFVVVFSV
jgi:hypothetical protein